MQMQIVIDIPDGCYEELNNGQFPVQDAYRLVAWIKDGIPLPEKHGRIIDESQIRHIVRFSERELYGDKIRYVKVTDAPTIIEADKGVLEKINEKQDSLRATCKAWDEAIQKDGYVD